MFDFVRNHQRWLQFILVLLIFPSFVFFGVQGYTGFMDASSKAVVELKGPSISQGELDQAHQQAIERMRQQMPGVDVKLFDTPGMKRQTLEGMVRERVLLAAAQKDHLFPADERLGRLFKADPNYAGLRQPDGSVNRDLLASQGLSSEAFAARLRTDYAMRQVAQDPSGSAFWSKSVGALTLDAFLESREVRWKRFQPSAYAAKITPREDDMQAFVKANADRFKLPESADVEYVVLDVAGLQKQMTVPEDDLKKYYSENESRYTSAQQRRASHILFQADKAAPADQRQKARQEAEKVLQEVRSKPTSFAELARKYSQDPGSAKQGGDLDFFGRGAMVKAFEDAVFAMKVGEISPVIESDFGFHIITLTAVRGGEKKSLESVKAEITAELSKQMAQRRFAELAEQFGNLVYEQSDSLQAVVDKLKLEKKMGRVERGATAPNAGPLANPKLLEAIFSDDVVRNKRNTEAVDMGSNQLVSARIVKHQPARVPELAEVKDQVRAAVVREKALAQSQDEGKARLAALQSKPDLLDGLSSPLAVSRRQAGDLPAEALNAALQLPREKLPASVGVELKGGQGYAVVWVGKVLTRQAADKDDLALQARMAQAWALAEAQSHLKSLESRFKVRYTDKAPAANTP